jgi:hypothetical protein
MKEKIKLESALIAVESPETYRVLVHFLEERGVSVRYIDEKTEFIKDEHDRVEYRLIQKVMNILDGKDPKPSRSELLITETNVVGRFGELLGLAERAGYEVMLFGGEENLYHECPFDSIVKNLKSKYSNLHKPYDFEGLVAKGPIGR